MSAFSDLAAGAIATQRGALGSYPTQVVAGTSWIFESPQWLDGTGTPVDFSAGAITATCRILDASGSVAATAAFSGNADGTFTVSVDESVTTTIVRGRYSWGLTLSDGTDVVAFWAPADSPFVVTASA